jgi:hypothetical protein
LNAKDDLINEQTTHHEAACPKEPPVLDSTTRTNALTGASQEFVFVFNEGRQLKDPVQLLLFSAARVASHQNTDTGDV